MYIYGAKRLSDPGRGEGSHPILSREVLAGRIRLDFWLVGRFCPSDYAETPHVNQTSGSGLGVVC